MGNLTIWAGVAGMMVACGGEEARPDPTSSQGGADAITTTSVAAATAANASSNAAATASNAATTDAAASTNAAASTADAASSADAAGSTGANMMGGEMSGNRLTVRYYHGTDGSIIRQGNVFDTQYGVECYFTRAADDAIRCLPGGSDVSYYAPSYFGDAACSTPAVNTCLPAATIAVSLEGAACGLPITRVYSLGAAVSLYFGSAANCQPAGINGRLLGAEIAPSNFVEGSLQ